MENFVIFISYIVWFITDEAKFWNKDAATWDNEVTQICGQQCLTILILSFHSWSCNTKCWSTACSDSKCLMQNCATWVLRKTVWISADFAKYSNVSNNSITSGNRLCQSQSKARLVELSIAIFCYSQLSPVSPILTMSSYPHPSYH